MGPLSSGNSQLKGVPTCMGIDKVTKSTEFVISINYQLRFRVF